MNTALNKYTKEAEESLYFLSKKVDIQKAEKLKRYINTQLSVYGLTSKEQSERLKQGFNFFEDSKLKTFKIFDKLYTESIYFEVKNLSFIYLDINHKHISALEQIKILPKWVKTVDNWAHSDNLSKFLSRLLEHEDTKDEMFKHIQKWNKSKFMWERRQSLVSLFYYSRTKTNYIDFEIAQQLIFNLIKDKEYYVQKSVGWALRECYNVYSDQTYSFIKKNITNITPIAFTTSIEKMTLKEKAELKKLRKKV